ncbi:MAG: septum site-determining protein MinD [Coprobacillaceae bacterium]
MSRIIVVTSGKGGVGKSSVSVNTASALAMQNFKVCLIDADFGLKNLDVMMGLENRVVYDLKDVIDGKCSIEQVLVRDKRIKGLSLLPACKSLTFDELDTVHMQALIENLQTKFDFIIVDSPAGVEKGFDYSISLANEAIVVVNLDVASLRDADRVVGLLMKKGIADIRMIVNKVNIDDIEQNKSITIEDAVEILSLPVLGLVYDDHAMIEANNKGVPIYLKQNHLLQVCFINIAKRILGNNVPYTKYKKKGIFRRIFLS